MNNYSKLFLLLTTFGMIGSLTAAGWFFNPLSPIYRHLEKTDKKLKKLNTRWYSTIDFDEQPDTVTIKLHDIVTETINAQVEDNNVLIITTDQGKASFAVEGNVLSMNFMQESSKDSKEKGTSAHHYFLSQESYQRNVDGQLSLKDIQPPSYQKDSKILTVMIPKQTKQTKQVPVNIVLE